MFQNFGKLLKEFSNRNGEVAISSIRDKVYKEIVDGNWWHIESYFKVLQEQLLSMNKNLAKFPERGDVTTTFSGKF